MNQPVQMRYQVRGFTYIGLLMLIAMMAIGLGAVSEVWHTTMQREREAELLDIGLQFQRALTTYYNNSPSRTDRLPRQMEDLLKDNRVPGLKRYLRRVYRDPMTGGIEWGLVKTAEGYITGVYSLSEKEPIKKANFPLRFRDFEGRTKYSDWVFMFQPARAAAPAAAAAGAAGAPGAPVTGPLRK